MHAQQALKIGSNPYTINSSAALEVESTTKGFLLPRMSHDEKMAIASTALGLVVWCHDCGYYGEFNIYNGAIWINALGTASATKNSWFNDITSLSGRIWMDRNLGATRVATSSTDVEGFGDLYQWGRGKDGHQLRTSSSISILSSSTTPGHGNFINSTTDWVVSKEDNLWQSVNGKNNPCPKGYYVPTHAELSNEKTAGINNQSTAYTILKLPAAGYRHYDGTLKNLNTEGNYWSSTVYNSDANYFYFSNNSAFMNYSLRSLGFSIRCIKE